MTVCEVVLESEKRDVKDKPSLNRQYSFPVRAAMIEMKYVLKNYESLSRKSFSDEYDNGR